jgi:hypothetical protein
MRFSILICRFAITHLESWSWSESAIHDLTPSLTSLSLLRLGTAGLSRTVVVAEAVAVDSGSGQWQWTVAEVV